MAAEAEKRDYPESSNIDDLSEEEKPSSGVTLHTLTPEMDAQWKAVFHECVQPRGLGLQEIKMEKLSKETIQQKKMEQQHPTDNLSQDWFNTEPTTLETRAYLLDKLLPTLIPGVEQLLRVAERKKLLDLKESQRCQFDPVNFLGEYLMRHNPSFDLTAQPNPYTQGLKVIADKLKTQVPHTTMHKLTEMKNLVEEKRQRRKDVENIKNRVNQLRKEALALQFQEWTLDASGQIPLALIQSALKSFLEVISPMHQSKGTDIYARPLEAVGTLDVKVNQEEFVEYLLSYIKNFTSDMFQELLKHLLQCAHDTRNIIRHDIWRQMFLQLFFDCDRGKIGLLDRPRVLSLLEMFFNSSSPLAKASYRDPRKWPIAELDDIDLIEFWGDLEPEEDEEDLPEDDLPAPERTLSEEATLLNTLLKDVLVDEELAAQGTDKAPEQPVLSEPEEAGLEQQVSQLDVGGEAVPTAASQDQAEMPVAELEPQGAETQEEPVPASEATLEPAAEGAEIPEGEEPAPEDQPVTVPEPGLEIEEAAEEPKPARDVLLSLTKVAVQVQKILDQEEDSDGVFKDSDRKAPPGESDLAAEEMGADEAGGQEEESREKEKRRESREEKAEPDDKRPSGPKDQAAAGTEGPPGTPATNLLPTSQASKEKEKGPQLVYGEVWSGSLEAADLTFKYAGYGKEIREDWNKEDSRFPDLRMNMIEILARGPPASTSPFDKNSLNLPQFVQVMETFVSERTHLPELRKLTEFVKKGYVQMEAEKLSQLEKIHHSFKLVRQQLLIAALFEKWDTECSGFLDMAEVNAVLSTFKEGMEDEALTKAKLQLPFPNWHPSGVVKLTQKDFQAYIELVVSQLTGQEDEVLDNIVEFLMMAVERTHLERLRENARRKWLLRIEHVAKTSGGCMEPVYQEVFKALSRDTDAHGDKKKVSAYIALLEYNVIAPERGDILLRYVACTEDDAPYVLNQILFMDMQGVSFAAALDDKPIHVPRVQLHGNIHFWNSDRSKTEQKGSFLVLPLEDVRRRVFGVLGLDTLQDRNEKTIFVPHEIRFYQGIAHSFSKAYHYIRTQQSLLQVIITAVGWLSGHAPGLQNIAAYFMEPGENRVQDYILRKVMASDLKGELKVNAPPAPTLTRKEDIFRDYLFKCVDCALVVTERIYREHHVAVPLRNPTGEAVVVLDLNLGHRQQLSPCAHKDLQKMLKMMQAATEEILKEDSGDLEPYYVLEAEYVGDWRRGGILFYRFMLQDLQSCIWNLDPWASFGDIRSLERPPALVHTVLKCALLVLYPQWAGTEEVEDWNCCVQKLDGELIENICYFDPTASYVEVRPEVLYRCLQGTPRRAVWRFGSAPLEYLYNWTRVCLLLIEKAKKLQHHDSVAGSFSALLTPSLSQSLRSSQISTIQTVSLAFGSQVANSRKEDLLRYCTGRPVYDDSLHKPPSCAWRRCLSSAEKRVCALEKKVAELRVLRRAERRVDRTFWDPKAVTHSPSDSSLAVQEKGLAEREHLHQGAVPTAELVLGRWSHILPYQDTPLGNAVMRSPPGWAWHRCSQVSSPTPEFRGVHALSSKSNFGFPGRSVRSPWPGRGKGAGGPPQDCTATAATRNGPWQPAVPRAAGAAEMAPEGHPGPCGRPRPLAGCCYQLPFQSSPGRGPQGGSVIPAPRLLREGQGPS
ncbi:EF-hand calcium-binding domain-containing protein 5 [Candoia aspera]|uniref:EF-hand calcium-binding domain-containing protein 5 n=1 Tax=Candoia aspera TaxID=51853 RepID=UPI002FD7B4A4